MKLLFAIIIMSQISCLGQYPKLGLRKGKIVNLNQRIVNIDSSLECK